MEKKTYAISFGERFSYALGDVGCNFIWSTVAAFLTLYYTDSVGISAAVVGTIMLVTRLLDGVTDLGFGVILDRTKSRFGKARAWILWSTPMMSIGLILLFSVPDSLSETGKIIYASLTYIFLACFAYTASNLSYNALLTLMTNDNPSKISANSIRFMCTSVFVIILAYVVPPLVDVVGWSMMSVIFAVLSALCFLTTFFVVKERNDSVSIATDSDKKQEEDLPVLESFKILFKNRYFYTICIMFLMYYINNAIFNGMGVYFCRDILHDINYFGSINACNMGAKFVSLMFVPFLANNFGKWKLMMMGWGAMVLGMAVMYLSSPHVEGVMAGAIIRGLGNAPISAGLFTIIADAVEYGEWKNGVNQVGLTNSATSFGMKVGVGLGSAIVGWGLAFGEYDPSLTVQSDFTLFTEQVVFFILPIVTFSIALVAMYFTNIDKIYPQIIKDLAERRSKAKEAVQTA